MEKDIEKVATLSGFCRAETNVQRPKFLVEQDIKNANYAYIPDFKRYYYIESTSRYNDKLTRLELTCDVLMSFRDTIKTMKIVIDRQMEYNKYVNSNYTLELKENVVRKDFSPMLDRENREIIMVNTKGGKWQ